MEWKFPRGLLPGLLTLALLTACSETLTDAEYLAQAQASREAGEINTAIIQLKSALQQNANSFDARYLLGIIYLERGQLSDAEKELSRAQQIDGSKSAVQVPLARSLFGQGKNQELLDQVVPADDLATDAAAEIFSYRSRSWLALGDTTKAEVELLQARALAPEIEATRIAAIYLATKKGDIETSRKQVEALLAQAPDSADAWALRGDLEYADGAMEEAVDAYGKAIAIRQDNSLDHLKRAIARISLKDYEGAQEDITIATGKDPESTVAIFAQGLLYFRQQRYAEAQPTLEKALNKSPDYMGAVFYLGATHLALNNLSQAEFNLQRYVTANPQSVEAVSLLAQTYNKLDTPDRTLKFLKPYLEGPEPNAKFLTLAGQAYLIKEDPAAAAMLLEEAAVQDPGTGTTHMMAGLARLQAGEEAAGLESLETAAGLGKPYRTTVALGFYYLNTKQYDKSLEAAARLESMNPDEPGIYNLKGRAYEGKQDFARARSSFEQALALKPDLGNSILRLAALDLKENKPDAARKRYESLLHIDRKSVAAMIGLADMARREGNDEEFISWVERARKANPSALMPRIYLTDYYVQQGEASAALRVAQEAAAANPDNAVALALLGKVQLAAGEKDGALATFEKLALIAPEAAAVQDQLARTYAAKGRIGDAREALQKALEFDPGYLDSISALSTLESQTGKLDEALELARRYQQLAPDSSTGLMLEGDALQRANRDTEALAAYEKALSMAPGDGRLVIKLHMARSRLGKPDAADEAVLTWLETNPGHILVNNYIAHSFLKRGLDGKAAQQYEKLAEVAPRNAMVFNNLANLYQRSGDSRALEIAERAYRLNPESTEIADTLGWILVENGKISRGLKLVEKAAVAERDNPLRQYHLAYSLAKAGQEDDASKLIVRLREMKLSPELENQVAQLSNELSL